MRPLVILCLLTILSCTRGDKKENILADVNGTKLYQTDIVAGIPTFDSEQDSMRFINQLAEEWTREQIILAQAKKESTSKDIERLVDNYRNELLISQYEQNLINKNLDTIVTETQISDYIRDNNISIKKGGPMVIAKFGKIRNNKPDLEKIDSLWQSEKWEDIKTYCGTFAEVCKLTDDWISLTELQQYFSAEIFGSDVLKKKAYSQKSDNKYEYFLSIIDYKKESEGISPSEKIKVKKLILHNRSMEYLKAYKEKLYQESLDDQKIKFYFN